MGVSSDRAGGLAGGQVEWAELLLLAVDGDLDVEGIERRGEDLDFAAAEYAKPVGVIIDEERAPYGRFAPLDLGRVCVLPSVSDHSSPAVVDGTSP